MSEDKTTLTERKALPHLTWMHYLKELERENPQSDQRDLTVVHEHAIRADKKKSYTFAKVSARGYLTEYLRLLLRCNRDGRRSIVCCAFGSNRSRTPLKSSTMPR